MLKITVINGKIDKALKILKRKVKNTKQKEALRNRKEFVKKSVTRRDEIKKAIHIQKIKDSEE
jgi:small subunit ribosomal protein S21